MEIWTIVGIAILTTIASLILKQLKPEFSIFCVLIGSVIIISMLFGYLENIFGTLTKLANKSGLSSSFLNVILKIIGIGYLAEFANGICSDAGCSSIGEKVILAAKIMILFLALPILNEIISIIMEILP